LTQVKTPGAGRRFDCALLRGFVLKIVSTAERLTAAIGRRIRAIAAVFRRPAELKGIDRASGQMVWDLDLSHTELYGTPTGRIASAGIANEPARKRDACQEPATVTQAYLPIGPSCC